MKENSQLGKKMLGFLRVIIAAYLVTGVLLLLLAFILYKWELSDSLMTIGTIIIYILSCFCAGFLIGKSGRQRAFVWGMLAGATYYMVLLAVALLMPEQENASIATILINLCICSGSGMAGAMIFR